MADDLQKLLMYIVDHPLRAEDDRTAQIDASAVVDVPEEMQKVAADRHSDAERLWPYFARGLRTAARHSGPLVVNDTDPTGNSIADAVARFLVPAGLATSQSTSISDDHYSYAFDLNWDKLRAIAQSAGINLDAALSGGATD